METGRDQGQIELCLDLVVDGAREPHTTRFAQRLNTSGDVDADAVNVITLDNYIADVDTDSEADALDFGQVGFPLGHAALHRNSAGDGVHYARELA
jgi:hypothetical protein